MPLSILAGIYMARAWRAYGYTGYSNKTILEMLHIEKTWIVKFLATLVAIVIVTDMVLDSASYMLFSDNAWVSSVIQITQKRMCF